MTAIFDTGHQQDFCKRRGQLFHKRIKEFEDSSSTRKKAGNDEALKLKGKGRRVEQALRALRSVSDVDKMEGNVVSRCEIMEATQSLACLG